MILPGEIIEIVGRPSSGRTSLFVESLATVTRGGGRVVGRADHSARAGVGWTRSCAHAAGAYGHERPRAPLPWRIAGRGCRGHHAVVGGMRAPGPRAAEARESKDPPLMACVWVPFFAAAAAERCEPALAERPLAIVRGTPPATRVVEANAVA